MGARQRRRGLILSTATKYVYPTLGSILEHFRILAPTLQETDYISLISLEDAIQHALKWIESDVFDATRRAVPANLLA